ncbi:MAG: DUF2794 domain-containing protein [Hyphomicrobiaceae bacterium]|nr:DUF2794 domain-containing protein [Hyphomicrobiaceae bacterium]
MSDSDPIKFSRHVGLKRTGSGATDGGRASQFETVSFTRTELNQILRVYGFQVAAGEWRDYAIDMMREQAVFSVFRHTSDVPLYRIEKNPKLARRQGAYSVVAASGHILKRGRDLGQVLRVLEPKPKLATI